MTYQVYYFVWLFLQPGYMRLRAVVWDSHSSLLHTFQFIQQERTSLPFPRVRGSTTPAYCQSCCMQSPLLNHLPFLEVRTDHHYSHYIDSLPPSQLNSRADNGSFALVTVPLPVFLCLLPVCLLIFTSHFFSPQPPPVVFSPFKSSARLYIYLSGLGTAWCP